MKRLRARPEIVPAVLLVLAFVAGAMQSKFFLDTRYLLDSSTLYVETGLLALGMTFVIVSGNIDLSVASMTVLVSCVTAHLMESGWGIPAAPAGSSESPWACLLGSDERCLGRQGKAAVVCRDPGHDGYLSRNRPGPTWR